MSVLDSETGGNSSNQQTCENFDGDSDEDTDAILPDLPTNSGTFKNVTNNITNSKSVLPNCPDITIIKKEKMEGKINNNSDHSEKQSGHIE